MARRTTTTLLAVAAALLALSAASAAAALVGIYRNGMETEAQRRQMVKLYGERCGRDGSDNGLRIAIGKRTRECAYRTPVIGRDLEIAATGRLLSPTPTALQNKAFLAVSLRSDAAGAGYQLAVYPLQRKAQLRKILGDGRVRYLAIEKNVSAVMGIDRANELRLQAFNLGDDSEAGGSRILAFVGGKLVADVTDEASGELPGRMSGFSVGAATGAKGVVASVDDVVIRVPSPF